MSQTELELLLSREIKPLLLEPQLLDRPSAWWAHVPFAFWITTVCKPRLLVELGTHHGVSYAAFCEAVARMRLATRCYAVDSWKGDPQAGYYGDDVYNNLKKFNDKRYCWFSELLRMTFDEARNHFADKTIDLLHIDGFHTYEAVRHDFETWRPKLSNRAVVLFHDTNVRRDDFGVWRFFEELKSELPSFEFLHGYGLGIAIFGDDAPLAIKELCGLTQSDDVSAVRERFSGLGARLVELFDKTQLTAQKDAEIAAMTIRLQERDGAIAERDGAIAERDGAIAEKESELAAMTIRWQERDGAIAEKESELAAMTIRLQERDSTIAENDDQIARTNGIIAHLSERYAEMAHGKAADAGEAEPKTSLPPSVGPMVYGAIRNSFFFDAKFYLETNPDVKAVEFDPALHYLLHGGSEGRNPSPFFSTKAYLSAHPDVAAAGMNALLHYELHGRSEGRALFGSDRFRSKAGLTEHPASEERGVGVLWHSLASIREAIDRAKIISFDVFDTLLIRRVTRPTDVFRLIEKKEGMANFFQKRIEAEAAARQHNFRSFGSREVSLNDIYDRLDFDEQVRHRLLLAELAAERMVLVPNPLILDAYSHAVRSEKTVIATSDVYLDADFISIVLSDNNLGVGKVFSSSSYKENDIGKHNGKIFKLIKEEFSAASEDIVHFGDNSEADIVQAQNQGLVAVHLPKICDALYSDNRFSEATVRLIDKRGSLESALVVGGLAKRRAEGQLGPNLLQTFGYLYGGVLVTAFAKFLELFAAENQIKKLLLFTRDGFVMREALNALMFDAASYELMFASRRMLVFPNFDLDDEQVITALFPPRAGRYELATELKRLSLVLNSSLNCERSYSSRDVFLQAVREHERELRKIANSEAEVVRAYFEQKMQNCAAHEVAIVDVGWNLGSHRGLEKLCDVSLHGAYVGVMSNAYDNGKIAGLLFDRDNQGFESVLIAACEIVELIFSDPSPAVVKMKREDTGITPVFQTMNAFDFQRNLFVHDVRQGIRDFIEDIIPYYKLLDVKEMKAMAREVLVNLVNNPSPLEYNVIRQIPHNAEAGLSKYRMISHNWHPRPIVVP